MQRSDDRAVRERNRPFPKSLDRYVVAELSAQLVELASSWATAMIFQSRYPGGIVTP